MPDQFDDLWKRLRQDAESWIAHSAPNRFDGEFLDKQFDEMPSMHEFEARVDGMEREALAHAYVNHVRRDAKTKVRQNLLDRGTRTVHSFFRAELNQDALFGPDGLVIKPVLYELDVDVFVPLPRLSIRETAANRQPRIKMDIADLETEAQNISLTLHLLDQGEEEDGTFGDVGPSFYRHFVANDSQ